MLTVCSLCVHCVFTVCALSQTHYYYVFLLVVNGACPSPHACSPHACPHFLGDATMSHVCPFCVLWVCIHYVKHAVRGTRDTHILLKGLRANIFATQSLTGNTAHSMSLWVSQNRLPLTDREYKPNIRYQGNNYTLLIARHPLPPNSKRPQFWNLKQKIDLRCMESTLHREEHHIERFAGQRRTLADGQ